MVASLWPILTTLCLYVYWIYLAPLHTVLSCGVKMITEHGREREIRRPSQMAGKLKRSPLDSFVMSTGFVLYVTYPSILRMSFQVLERETVCNQDFVSMDERVKWLSPSHQYIVFVVAAPTILLYGVMLPVGTLWYLSKQKRRNKSTLFRFGLVYSGYDSQRWYWEAFVFFRKLCMMLVVTFSREDILQLQYALFILVFALHMQHRWRPFDHRNRTPNNIAGGSFSSFQNSTVNGIVRKRKPRRTAMVIVTDTNKNLLHRLELASLFILFCTVWCAGFFGSQVLCETTWCQFLSFGVVSSNLLFVFLILILFTFHFGGHNKFWNKDAMEKKFNNATTKLLHRVGSKKSVDDGLSPASVDHYGIHDTSVGEVKSWDSDITTVLNVLGEADNKREREKNHLKRGSKLVNKSIGSRKSTRKSTMKNTRGSMALAKRNAVVEMIDYPKNKEGTNTIEFKTEEDLFKTEEDLPDGWDFATDADGDIYYYNETTEAVSWERPTSTASKTLVHVNSLVPK